MAEMFASIVVFSWGPGACPVINLKKVRMSALGTVVGALNAVLSVMIAVMAIVSAVTVSVVLPVKGRVGKASAAR